MDTNLDVLLEPSDHGQQDTNEFSQLWDKITKAEKSYQRAEQKRRAIFEEFIRDVQPVEERLSQVRYNLLDRLIQFYESSHRWVDDHEKAILREWIESVLDELYFSPFKANVDYKALVRRYQQGCLQIHGHKDENQIDDQDKTQGDNIDDQDKTQGDNVEESLIKAMLFGYLKQCGIHIEEEIYEARFKGKSIDEFEVAFEEFMREELGQQTYDDAAYEDEFENRHEASNDTLSDGCSDFNDAHSLKHMLSKLYKKVAQKIHPDKAKDDVQREEFNTLMQKLSQAKKDGDLYTILSIIRSHSDATDMQLTEQQLDSLLDTLEQKLWYLKRQREGLKHESTLESMVYKKFNGRGKAAISKKMAEYNSILREDIRAYEHDFKSVSNLKKLKKKLKMRDSSFLFRSFL